MYVIYTFKDLFKNSGNSKNNSQIKEDNTKQSIGRAEIELIANIQESAMANSGTDEFTLFESIKNLNGEDLKAVYNFFGKRNYAFTGKGGNLIGELLSLPEWYHRELNDSDLKKMRNIWSKAKIIF